MSSSVPVSFESLERTQLSDESALAIGRHAVYPASFAIGDVTVSVRFSHERAAAAFARRFADMRSDRQADVVVYAVGLANEAYFWRTPDRAYRWGRGADHELLVFFADNVAMHEHLSASDDVGLHAAVIGVGSELVALVGRSTAGKTTTAVAAVRNGHTFYSDERCILQRGRVVPFLRAITLREGGRAALAPAATSYEIDERLRALPDGGDVVLRPSEMFAGYVGYDSRPLDAIVSIVGRGADASISRCSLYSLLPDILASMICREDGVDRVARAVTALGGVATYRMTLGTPHASVTAMERAFDGAFAGA